MERFLFASTGGALYGEPECLPCNEGHPIQPLSVYGAAKYAFEVYLSTYYQTYGLPVTILRYANVYGPRQNPYGEAGVIAIFIRQMTEGRSPIIFGTGEQERDFVYVGDVIEALMLCAGRSLPSGSVFNIGSGVGTPVKRVAERVLELMDNPVELRLGALETRPDEIMEISADISAARERLDWQPTTSLDEGLRESIAWFSENRELALGL